MIEMKLIWLIRVIVLQLISIPGWANKNFTISMCPYKEAKINGVSKVIG